jgi:hypothetical protein
MKFGKCLASVKENNKKMVSCKHRPKLSPYFFFTYSIHMNGTSKVRRYPYSLGIRASGQDRDPYLGIPKANAVDVILAE